MLPLKLIFICETSQYGVFVTYYIRVYVASVAKYKDILFSL